MHTLSLRGYVLYGEEVDGIETMSNLTELDLGMCTTYRLLTRKFQMLTKLKTLRIPQSGITDEILIHIIQNNPELEHLDVSVKFLLCRLFRGLKTRQRNEIKKGSHHDSTWNHSSHWLFLIKTIQHRDNSLLFEKTMHLPLVFQIRNKI